MYCPIILPVFLQYLTNADYMIISWSVTSKYTLMTPNNSSTCGVNLEIKILAKFAGRWQQ